VSPVLEEIGVGDKSGKKIPIEKAVPRPVKKKNSA
jgi:hypothetical protein